jgi:hypothetical protein
MRTKIVLLSAVAIATGLLSSQAQSNVYSANVVGYYKVTTAPGYNLIGNQFSVTTANSVVDVLSNAAAPGALQNCQLLKYLPASGSFTTDLYDEGSGGWIDNVTGDPSTNSLHPGEGWFFYNANLTNLTLTLLGTVPQGTNLVRFAPGYSVGETPIPGQLFLEASNGFPVVNNMQYQPYTNASGNGAFDTADIYDIGSGGWINNVSGDPEVPNPKVGESYFIYNPEVGQLIWTNVFIVQ